MDAAVRLLPFRLLPFHLLLTCALALPPGLAAQEGGRAQSRPSQEARGEGSSATGTRPSEAPPSEARPSEARRAEKLEGPPVVSAKAWLITDLASGKVLWSDNDDKPLPMASTTKMMTALLVARLASIDAKVLQEQVQVSTLADGTGGSSANIRAGEKIPVGELLYGLLLPSGNDAANAFAEHFGDRFDKPAADMRWPPHAKADQKPQAWRSFVAEMNRVAKAIGMKDTQFWNPHGLDCPGHETTARDLAILGRRVMRSPLLRRYVATRVHHARMRQPGGGVRPVIWRNTNRLLEIEGYGGVKTGTTRHAGACLVSSAKRGKDRLLVVVLGCSSGLGRYVDSRNLYRWAFLELGHRD